MSASSAGSGTAFAFGILSIGIFTLLILRHYLPLRSTPAYLLFPIFLALALPASIILLVPIDLASSAASDDGTPRGIWLPSRALLVCWRISYWLTFMLTWFILPLLGDYADAGHLDPKQRMLYSIRTNIRYYLIMLAVSIAALVYFFLSSGLDTVSVKAMVIATAYAWGLILAIYLMGHGLVAIPRGLYRSASISGRLRRLQAHAPRIHEQLLSAVESLEALEAQVVQLKQRKTGIARDFQDWIEELAQSSDMPEGRILSSNASRLPEGTIPAVITERYLADLTRKLKRARHRRIRFVEEWARCVQTARDLQVVLDAFSSQRLDFLGSMSPFQTTKMLSPYMRYLVHAYALPGLRLLFSGVFAIASVCIIWSEIFSRAVPKLSIVGISIVHHPSSDDGQIGFGGQVMAACWLLYMMTAALTSISEVKVWGGRALVTRHTYAESACWYAALIARLTVPLSYNFTTFLPAAIFENTAFYQFLGKLINLTPLGTGFSAFFPIFVLIPVCATAFNLYGKVKSFAGFGAFEDENDEPYSGWREGKALIDREIYGADGVGLSSRDHSPRPPLLPILGQSAASTSGTGDRLLSQYRDAPASTTTSRRSTARTAPAEADGEDSNFFSDFAHRVRNTIDTTERPDWVPNFDFKKPKWMGGGEESAESADRLGRWFGGRAESGRLRL